MYGSAIALELLPHSSVSALSWHPATGCLVSSAEDGVIVLWEWPWDAPASEQQAASPPQPVHRLSIEGCEVLCLRPSADGTALFCGLDDGGIALLANVPPA